MKENKFNNKDTMYLTDAIHVLKKDRRRMLKIAEDFPEFSRWLSEHIQAQDAVLDFVNEVIKEIYKEKEN